MLKVVAMLPLVLHGSRAFLTQSRLGAVKALSSASSGDRVGSGDCVESAHDKLLPKLTAEGAVKFDNPSVGDFQVFDTCLKYPCYFDMKVVGNKEGDFAGDLQRTVAGALGQDAEKVTYEVKERIKYMSVTLRLYVQSSDQLYAAYEAVDKDKRVKFKF